MHTIGRLASRFGLSRSTLLYYDSIGLLSPSGRTESEYRIYSEEDAKRLDQICLYRRAGLKLTDIKKVLDASGGALTSMLEQRLDELNEDINRLRSQQRLIIGLLQNNSLFERITVMNKETWTELLSASGFSEDDMIKWHVEFERHDPEKHLRFLEFLGIPDEEIEAIRSYSREGATGMVTAGN